MFLLFHTYPCTSVLIKHCALGRVQVDTVSPPHSKPVSWSPRRARAGTFNQSLVGIVCELSFVTVPFHSLLSNDFDLAFLLDTDIFSETLHWLLNSAITLDFWIASRSGFNCDGRSSQLCHVSARPISRKISTTRPVRKSSKRTARGCCIYTTTFSIGGECSVYIYHCFFLESNRLHFCMRPAQGTTFKKANILKLYFYGA